MAATTTAALSIFRRGLVGRGVVRWRDLICRGFYSASQARSSNNYIASSTSPFIAAPVVSGSSSINPPNFKIREGRTTRHADHSAILQLHHILDCLAEFAQPVQSGSEISIATWSAKELKGSVESCKFESALGFSITVRLHFQMVGRTGFVPHHYVPLVLRVQSEGDENTERTG